MMNFIAYLERVFTAATEMITGACTQEKIKSGTVLNWKVILANKKTKRSGSKGIIASVMQRYGGY